MSKKLGEPSDHPAPAMFDKLLAAMASRGIPVLICAEIPNERGETEFVVTSNVIGGPVAEDHMVQSILNARGKFNIVKWR